jgi:hypothetical protein
MIDGMCNFVNEGQKVRAVYLANVAISSSSEDEVLLLTRDFK